jgi:hypothetical protein
VCGNIYPNINIQSVGNIDNLNLKQIIYEQITDKKSIWIKNKYSLAPCDKCIYNLLCPPISNYELVLGQNNLCNLVNKDDDGKTATTYKTESLLFPNKNEVQLQKHLNSSAGRAETLKNGQDL